MGIAPSIDIGGNPSSITSSSSSSSSSSSLRSGPGASASDAVDTGSGDAEDADEDILDLRQQFHNTVRENIIFLLFFLTLCIISWTVIGLFIRKKEKDDQNPDVDVDPKTQTLNLNLDIPPPPTDDDESLVYRICFWLCVFSLSISMGATLLLPISIISNEVLLLYPRTYYVQWLNGMLIQGLWNLIFLFANISLFILLPFAHLFMESEGFSGHKKGLAGKFYETVVVLILAGFAIWGLSHILAAVLSPHSEKSVLGGLFNLIGFTNQLPFIYSCISFFGVLLLLLCTPLGAGRIFTILSHLLVGPQFLRNLEEEHRVKFLEIESLKNKLNLKIQNTRKMNRCLSTYYETKNKSKNKTSKNKKEPYDDVDIIMLQDGETEKMDMEAMREKWAKLSNRLKDSEDLEDSINLDRDLELDIVCNHRDPEFIKLYHRMMSISSVSVNEFEDSGSIRSRLKCMEEELLVLEKLKKTPGWRRNLVYPLAFLIVLVLTALTVFMVIINTLQLVVGLKALPLSAQSFSLGLSSMSVLGAWGAGLEIILILYLITTSIIGLYSLPGVRNIKPCPGNSPTSHIIYNCALVLILSSALPLLSRILGITNFDLLGNYGQIQWLGNFYIVFLYNVIFSVASTLCLMNKFTSAIRQELMTRLRSVFRFRYLLPYFTTTTTARSHTGGSSGGGGGGSNISHSHPHSHSHLSNISNLSTNSNSPAKSANAIASTGTGGSGNQINQTQPNIGNGDCITNSNINGMPTLRKSVQILDSCMTGGSDGMNLNSNNFNPSQIKINNSQSQKDIKED